MNSVTQLFNRKEPTIQLKNQLHISILSCQVQSGLICEMSEYSQTILLVSPFPFSSFPQECCINGPFFSKKKMGISILKQRISLQWCENWRNILSTCYFRLSKGIPEYSKENNLEYIIKKQVQKQVQQVKKPGRKGFETRTCLHKQGILKLVDKQNRHGR